MFNLDEIKDLLARGDANTLTIMLEVNPALRENQATNPAWRIWLKNALKQVQEDVPDSMEGTWEDIRGRVDDYFRHYQPKSKSVALFYGPGLDEVYELAVPLQNRAVFGRPFVAPLLWAANEYERYLIVLVDHEKAHCFNTRLGGAGTEDTVTLEMELDTSDWRQKSVMPSTTPGQAVIRGNARDAFENRVEEHIERFHSRVAEEIETQAERHHIDRIVLGGNEQAACTVRSALASGVANRIIGIMPIPMNSKPSDVLKQVLPVALEYERKHEMQVVEAVINLAKSGQRGVLGRDAVLSALEQRRVEQLVVPWPLADADLRSRLSVQAFEAGSDVEMVRGAAAERLDAEGGLAAKLYYAT